MFEAAYIDIISPDVTTYTTSECSPRSGSEKPPHTTSPSTSYSTISGASPS